MGSTIAGSRQNAVSIAAGVGDFTILGNRLGPAVGFGPNGGYAVDVVVGASDHYVIQHNRSSGNTTGGIHDLGTGTNKSVQSSDF